MKHLYAAPSPKLVKQILLDVLVVAWCVGWWFAGRAVDAVIRGLGDHARGAEGTARELERRAGSAADAAGDVPLAGSALRTPLDGIADSLGGLAANAADLAAQIDQLASRLGAASFLVPVLLVVPLWVWHRVRFWRDSSALARLSSRAATELLALRALSRRPVHQLAALAPDLADAWRRGDPAVLARLAALEARATGLAPRGRAVSPPA